MGIHFRVHKFPNKLAHPRESHFPKTMTAPHSEHICFTINNPSEFCISVLKNWGTEIENQIASSWPINNRCRVTCLAYQLERGEAESTPHVQGYLQTNLKTSVYKLTDKLEEYFRVRPHVEACKGSSDDNLAYVSKEDTRLIDTDSYQFGAARDIAARGGQGQRTDLLAVQAAIDAGELPLDELRQKFFGEFCKFDRFLTTYFNDRKQQKTMASLRSSTGGRAWRFPWQAELAEMITHTPQPRRISWWWEAIGNVGKSYMARHLALHCEGVIITAMKKADMLHLLTKTLSGARCVAFDLTRTTEDGSVQVVYEVLEQLSNGFVCSGKYDSQQLWVQDLHLIVFANFAPDRTKMSEDRWDVHHINSVAL